MVENYLKIAFRNLFKQKVYGAINIFGLAIGIAGAILAFLFVRDELSFDRFHENSERIFKINLLQQLAGEGSEQLIGLSPIPLGPDRL